MSTDFILRHGSQPTLTSAALETALGAIAQAHGLRLALDRPDICVSLSLAPRRNHGALAVRVSFLDAGVEFSTRGPTARVARWLAVELSRRVGGRVFDPQAGVEVSEQDDTPAVRAIIAAHELEAADEARRNAPEDCPYDLGDLQTLLIALKDAGGVELGSAHAPELASLLPHIADPTALYAALLAHPSVDEVFVDVDEFVELWRHWVG